MLTGSVRTRTSARRETVMGKVHRTIVVGAVLVASIAAEARSQDACKASSLAVFDSCKAGAASDRALAVAKCDNLPDAAARKACGQQAASDRKDSSQSC